MKGLKILLFLIPVSISTINISGHSSDTTRILFIGSSIIGYYHSVPDILDSLAVSSDTIIISEDVSQTGFTFEKHLRNPATMAKISEGDWDYSYLACWGGVTNDTQDDYAYPWLKMLCDSLRKYSSNIRIILSMNHIMDSDVFYAGATGYDDPYWDNFYKSILDKNLRGYQTLATEHNTMLDPFALVWDEVYKKSLPGINLYGPDGVHLNAFGAYLMASDIYSMVFLSSPVNISYAHQLNSDTCLALRQAADKIIFHSFNDWGIISAINHIYELSQTFNIYPNPASYRITLDIEIQEEIRVELISYYSGQSVITRFLPSGLKPLVYLDNIPPGLYLVRVSSPGKVLSSKLIIH